MFGSSPPLITPGFRQDMDKEEMTKPGCCSTVECCGRTLLDVIDHVSTYLKK